MIRENPDSLEGRAEDGNNGSEDEVVEVTFAPNKPVTHKSIPYIVHQDEYVPADQGDTVEIHGKKELVLYKQRTGLGIARFESPDKIFVGTRNMKNHRIPDLNNYSGSQTHSRKDKEFDSFYAILTGAGIQPPA